jgi:hypothetical protein
MPRKLLEGLGGPQTSFSQRGELTHKEVEVEWGKTLQKGTTSSVIWGTATEVIVKIQRENLRGYKPQQEQRLIF